MIHIHTIHQLKCTVQQFVLYPQTDATITVVDFKTFLLVGRLG